MRLPLLLALLLTGCSKSGGGPAGEPKQVLQGFHIKQSVNSDPRWTLKSQEAVLLETSKEADLVQPRMEFFQKGKVISRVRADSGTVQTETHDVTLSSGVVLEGLEEQSRLETAVLHYSSKDDLFQTDAPVLVTKPGGRLRGRGLKARPDLSEVRIFNQETVVQ